MSSYAGADVLITGRSAGRLVALAGGLLLGCGLTLDLDPPDPTGMDAAVADAAVADAGTRDAGPAVECVEDVECDDGDACSGREQCVDGACVPGEPITCPDDDVCDGVSTCVDGSCVAGPPPSCVVDDDPCNGAEICDPVIGCTVIPHPGCDDGIDCTVDACVASVGCENAPDDGLCTAGDNGVCDPATGGCQYETCDTTTCAPTGCFDATCDAGTCVRTYRCGAGQMCCGDACVAAGCDDGNDCTVDSCGPGGCLHAPSSSTTLCDDGDSCTVGERCDGSGGCGGGSPVICSDGNDCTDNLCSPLTGCFFPPFDGTPCNDGNACSMADTCSAGVCVGGPLRTCAPPPDRPCLIGSCDTLVGCRYAPAPAGRACSVSSGAVGTCDAAGNCCGPDADCDGDGICECQGPLDCGFAGGCPGFDCTNDTACGSGRRCCLTGPGGAAGYCYAADCPGCCPPP